MRRRAGGRTGPKQTRTPPAPSRSVAAVVASIVAIGFYGISLVLVGRPADGYDTLWDGWVFHVALTLPALPVVWRALRDRREAAAWWLIATGIALNTAGNLIYTYYDQNQDPIPVPSWSDLPYLLSYVVFAAAFVVLMKRRSEGTSIAVHFDGLVIGLCAGAFAVMFWFQSLFEQTGSTLAVVVGLAYPLFDVVFVVIVVSGLAPVRFRPDAPAATFVLGIAAFTVGDIVFMNQIAAGTYHLGTWLELTWMIGLGLFGIASVMPARRSRGSGRGGNTVTFLPVAAAAAALVLLAIELTEPVPVLASCLALASISAALVRVGLTVRELRRANDAFRQARTDELTGLVNRRGFSELLDEMLTPSDASLAVLMIDLDGFKEVNDSLGHHAGDRLLAIVGQRFARAVPAGAVMARLGGDEFGIVIAAGPEVAEQTARAIRSALDAPISVDAIAIRVGASVGIAHTDGGASARAELMRRADVAMYDAKSNHRGFAWYDATCDPHGRDRLVLIEELRTAITQRSFEMHYQPTIDVISGAVVGREALVRWRHPTRGLLPPSEFIPLAERTGLIPAITRAVLDLSIADLSVTLRRGRTLHVSVNISAKDLVDEDLTAYICGVLDAYAVPPQLLTLEITETALCLDIARAERTLLALRAHGIRISIDDFGVGYSSMSQLLNLPLDELKLDRSFIANLEHDVRARAILSATVELGRTLGLKIVAEGIETAHALDEVAHRGVDTAQGYFISRPLPVTAFDRFLQQHDDAVSAVSAVSPVSSVSAAPWPPPSTTLATCTGPTTSDVPGSASATV